MNKLVTIECCMEFKIFSIDDFKSHEFYATLLLVTKKLM